MGNRHVYRLQGLSCVNCAAKFEQNVKAIATVKEAHVNFGAAKLTVIGEASIGELEKAGAFDGIRLIPEHAQTQLSAPKFWQTRATVLALISACFLMVGYAASLWMKESEWLAVGAFALAIAVGGYDLLRVGLLNLWHFRFDMKTLMTIAIIGAAFIGEWKEGAVVVLLFAISEALERYAMDRSRRSIQYLIDAAPKKAMVRKGNQEYEVDVDELEIDDIMIVKPGQKIAADGIVVHGASAVNEATITGESMPVYKSVNDEVYAGTINEEGALEVKVTKKRSESMLAKMIDLVEEAQAERAPAQQLVDRFARYYTPLIMLIAFIVAVMPPLLFEESWEAWVYRGLAVLVVGCPCALVISTPVAIVTAIGHAARRGILIKGGIYLEEMGKIAAIAFDKTGTLTKGTPEVAAIRLFSNHVTEEEWLQIAAAIEKYSQHPIASAIVRKAQERGVVFTERQVTNFYSITGKGASASVDGITYYIGSPALFSEYLLSKEVHATIQQLQQPGNTVVVLGSEHQLLGVAAVSDQVREYAADTIQELCKEKIKQLTVVTGDHRVTAEYVGRSIGLTEIQAELLPEDKLRVMKEMREKYGRVAMIGDGVNDAPALAAANVGVAMGTGGTDVALETADIVLMGDDLRQLPYVIRLSRKALRMIKENIVLALSLKLLALILIVPGWLTLWMAIFADMGATFIVLFNSMRLMRI
ncbi:cadmium-translocating P-type ATPase [Anoxybacillus rupiensis]|uniref:heavy metal translocating P-type ATPase n=1 Tax=Anoxybacteroides rupiense TaxID=311460 RepID=UPI001BA5BF21|nr:heavy metal translocating P-type ATPase [Anoxybacillus rupiensis]MBS2771854.1 cadmium-translocating P-type ATPase [Anoxybacillus rupiensis]